MSLSTVGIIVALTFGSLLAPLCSDAQQPGKMPRIGYVSTGAAAADQLVAAFREGLRAHGYIEGQNMSVEYRYTEGTPERLADLVAELVHLRVDVIVTPGTPAARAAQQATTTIPIVTITGDPVGAGFVASLARPGGNMTGLAVLAGEGMGGKWLELLKEAIPRVSRVTYLLSPANAISLSLFAEMQRLAPALSLNVHAVEVRSPDELDRASLNLSDFVEDQNGLYTSQILLS